MSLDPYSYPVAGFSFELTLYKDGAKWKEIRCQSVTGVEMSVKWSTPPAGKKPPTPLPPLADGLSFADLVVTKGVVPASNADDLDIINYMQSQASNTATPFLEMTLILLNSEGDALRGWSYRGVIIAKWKVSGFDAQKSGFAVDEITFKYREFTLINWN
jgi:phage tail-like protein